MGCDIHFYAERREADGTWTEVVPPPGPCEFCKGEGEVLATRGPNAGQQQPCFFCTRGEDEDDDGLAGSVVAPAYGYVGVPGQYREEFYEGRNYNLFAILADVRNGRGFAGVKTGEGFRPIAAPRGLPADVSATVKARSDRWGGDGHSHSWFTVAELDAYDWRQETAHYGVVSPFDYAAWKKEGKPRTWSAGVSGPGVEMVSHEQMDAVVAKLRAEARKKANGNASRFVQLDEDADPPSPDVSFGFFMTGPGPHYFTRVAWRETYADSAERFLTKTLPALRAVGPADAVRAVFWFDN